MARGFNKVILVGNLTREPELRYTSSQIPVASFTLAVNRMWRGKNGETQEQVDFIPIVVWNQMGENCHRYLKKGSPALVEGRISVRSYEDKQGQKRYVTEVVAETVQFLGGRRDGDDSAPRAPLARPNGSQGGDWSHNQQSSDDDSSLRSVYGDAFNGGGDFAMDISKLPDEGNFEGPSKDYDREENIPF